MKQGGKEGRKARMQGRKEGKDGRLKAAVRERKRKEVEPEAELSP